MAFIQAFLVWAVAVYVVLRVVSMMVPPLRNEYVRVFALLLALGAGYVQGVSAVSVQAQAWTKSVLETKPFSDTAARSLVGDSIPLLKKVGGKVTPQMMEATRLIATDGSPCASSLAKQFLGETADEDACL